jgi:hypothetical protein
MVQILVRNKFYLILALFLVQLIPGHSLLYSRGKNDADITISTSGLCDFDLALNERVAKDILDRFRYIDSIGAYYYQTENSSRLFNKIYLWLKLGRIIKIIMISNIDKEDIYSKDSYKPEYAMQIIYSRYSNFGIPAIEKYAFREFSMAGEYYCLERVTAKWTTENININFSYVPYYNFTDLNMDIFDDEIYRFDLSISVFDAE